MRSLLPVLAARKSLFRSFNYTVRGYTKSRKPTVEALESRYLLARTILWVGPTDGGLWSNGNNWVDTGGVTGTPISGDSVVFDPNSTYMGRTGTNTNCTDDIASLALASLTISHGATTGYSGTITINSGDDLRVTSTISIASGTIAGPGSLTLDGNPASFTWFGGTLNTVVSVGTPTNSAPTMAIRAYIGNVLKTIGNNVNGGSLYTYGATTYTGTDIPGDVLFILSNSALINYGTFDIQWDGHIGGLQDSTANLTNQGTLKKSVGGSSSSSLIDCAFTNGGLFEIDAGKVRFSPGTSAFDVQTGGTTRINNTTLSTDRTYYVAGGVIEGVGNIDGNLSTDNTAGDGSGSGVVHPGIGNSPGNIAIINNHSYTQTSLGMLAIDINAAGVVGKLNIQGTGVATLNGTVKTTRNPNYRPAGGTTLTFMTYGSASGDFTTFQVVNQTWSDASNTYTLGYLSKGVTNYQLQVFFLVAPPPSPMPSVSGSNDVTAVAKMALGPLASVGRAVRVDTPSMESVEGGRPESLDTVGNHHPADMVDVAGIADRLEGSLGIVSLLASESNDEQWSAQTEECFANGFDGNGPALAEAGGEAVRPSRW